MNQIKLTIDEREITAQKGALLIDVLIENEIEIPYFCYHESLGADGNCRMCMIEIDGQKRPQIACDTNVKDGMIVRTKGDKIDSVRRRILELELINHPVDCPICDQAGECKLQDFYMDYGLYDSNISADEKVHHKKHVDLGSNVMLDQERCVLCARCTRFTSNITKTHELGIIGRGDHSRVDVMPNKKLDNPYAMNVVDLCPVGALTSKDFRFTQRSWFLKSTPVICHGCAKGCNIFIDHNREKYKDDQIYRFRPRKNMEINGHFICDHGRLSYKNLQTDRQLEPIFNEDKISEDEALKCAKRLIHEHKDNISILISPELYTQEIDAIIEFANRIGAKVSSPLKSYIDDSFGDKWLRSNLKCANGAYIKKLHLDQSILSECGLLINFNHKDFENTTFKESIYFSTHSVNASFVLPLATFSESSGTLINEDGISQYSQQAIYKNAPILNVCEWIKKIDEVNL